MNPLKDTKYIAVLDLEKINAWNWNGGTGIRAVYLNGWGTELSLEYLDEQPFATKHIDLVSWNHKTQFPFIKEQDTLTLSRDFRSSRYWILNPHATTKNEFLDCWMPYNAFKKILTSNYAPQNTLYRWTFRNITFPTLKGYIDQICRYFSFYPRRGLRLIDPLYVRYPSTPNIQPLKR